MVELDVNKIQIKYFTGINRRLDGYPTPLDVLYESCMENSDNNLFSREKMENRYNIGDERIDDILDELVENGYIKKNSKNYKILNTPWS